MLGVSSGERAARFAYDARSRLEASVFGTKSAAPPTVPVPGRTKEELSAADFRRTQERKSQFDEPTQAVVRAKGVDTAQVDPPTATFDEKPGGGHKIDKVTKGPVVRPFGWSGAERVDDGRFVYQFDARGRLVRATEKTAIPPVRRILYSYTGSGRMVGRRAEYANVASPGEEDWKLEDRATILAADALPADTTFVWDPITDRLLSVFAAGNPSAPLKQIIHGDLAYDDPLETTTPTERLYPVYDEAAAGGLQLVLNTRAEVVARNLPNDPYGAHDLSFVGAAIDGAGITASKTSITISLHATEQLSPTTIATGVRLAAVDAAGSVVRVSSSTPSLTDPYTVSWTLTPAELTTLTAARAASLSIAATSSLRATAWSSDVPVMPAPEWAVASKPVYTSPTLPFEVRESLSSLASFLATIPETEERTTALYEVETLALLASPSRPPSIAALSTASFQALPFVEAPTGLIYARARWYDPGTGSFLSPDPMGYRDSSNLYAFAGGDPVNGRDPTGEQQPCQNTTLASLQASGGAAVEWGKKTFANFMDFGANQTVKLLDNFAPGQLGWVSENAERARSDERRTLSRAVLAVERGEATPVHVIGGAVDRRVQAVDQASRSGCKEDIARATTGPLLDLAALRGAASQATGARPTPVPVPVLATGTATAARMATTAAPPVVPSIILASNANGGGPRWKQYEQKHGAEQTEMTTSFGGREVKVRLDKAPTDSEIIDFKDYDWARSAYRRDFIQKRVTAKFTEQILKYQTIRPNVHYQFSQEPPTWVVESIQQLGATYSVVP